MSLYITLEKSLDLIRPGDPFSSTIQEQITSTRKTSATTFFSPPSGLGERDTCDVGYESMRYWGTPHQIF